jgi:hypothetical protein
MSKDIVILVDYNKRFFSSTTNKAGVDISLIKNLFENRGYKIVISSYNTIDYCDKNLFKKYVLYPSSEDEGLFYKDYIEDVLLMLKESGAILLPEFKYFRAHHNKSCMEMLRKHLDIDELLNIETGVYGTIEEYRENNKIKEPIVIKAASGAGSRFVFKSDDIKQTEKIIKQISKASYSGINGIKDLIAPFFYSGYKPVSRYRKKFIIQKFIPNLMNDWKILVFGNKYYIMKRDNRENDFRASGSGVFSWPEENVDNLLWFAKNIFEKLDVPFLSLDVAFDGKQYYALEFQFTYFGPICLQRSKCFFSHDNHHWVKTVEQPLLEREIVNSVDDYIKSKDET